MNLRRASVVVLAAVLCLSLVPPAARAVQADPAQFKFVNDTIGLGQGDLTLGVVLHFYVDGEDVGTVLPGDSLTVEVTPGSHKVEAKSTTAGNVSKQLAVDEGDTTVWTITLK